MEFRRERKGVNRAVKHQKPSAEELMETEEKETAKNNDEGLEEDKCRNTVKEQEKEVATPPVPESTMLPPPPKDNFEQEVNDLYRAVPEVATHFYIESKIGEGTFSSVYLARLRNCPEIEEKFALKHVIPTSHPSRIENELRCLLKIGGRDNVMGVKLCLRHRDHVVLVMPFLAHERFQDHLQGMSLKDAREYMWNLLTALRRVHEFNVIHRDVKPSNFLFNKERKEYALVDFGLASGPILSESPSTRIQAERAKLETSTTAGTSPLTAASSTMPPPPPISGASAQVAANPLKSPKTSPRLSTPTGASCSGINSKPGPGQGSGSASGKRIPLSPTKRNQANGQKDHRSSPRKRPTEKKTTFISKQSFTRSLSLSSLDKAQSGLCECYGKPIICEICIGRRNQLAPRAGTSGFRAPEVLMRCPEQTTAVDIWSAGVIFLSILSGRYPFFRAQDDLGFLSQIISLVGTESMVKAALSLGKMLTVSETLSRVDLKTACVKLRSSAIIGKLGPSQSAELVVTWGDISDHPFDLLAKLLDPNPKTRISAENALRHPFFSDCPDFVSS